MNYLWPLFRGLARTIEAGSNSGQATVIQAKKKIGYARGDLDILSKGGNPKGTKQNFKEAYDIYYDWIVSRDNKTVKALTGKDRRFWTDFERRLEKTTEESKGTMNFTSINHALTQAINNLAEGEIDVAALAMAEDIEKEELDEAKRTKKEQQRIDGRSLKKYGMKWRSTPSGAVIGLTRKGKVVAGPPDMLKSLPKEKLSRKAKETMAAIKDEAPQKAKKTKAINKMLSGKKKSSADKLRDTLAKAKKKMGKGFNAMLMQDMGEIDDISEGFGPKGALSKGINAVMSAGIIANKKYTEQEIEKYADELGMSREQLIAKAFANRMIALKKGARPVSGTQNDLKAEMAAMAKAAKALGEFALLRHVAAKHSPKR